MAATDILDESVRVVLFCAEDDEPALVMTMQLLHLRGVNAELIPGIDQQPRKIGEVLDNTRGDGVFVLCESGQLDRSARLRLEGLFGARKGPGHVLVNAEVGVDSDDDVCARVRAAIPNAIAAGSAARGEDTPFPRRGKNRDVVNMGAVETSTPQGGVPKTSRSVRRDDEDDFPQRDNTDEIAFEDLHPHERGEQTPRDAGTSIDEPRGERPAKKRESQGRNKPAGKAARAASRRSDDPSRGAGARRRWATYAGISLAAAVATGLGVWAINQALVRDAEPTEDTRSVQAGAAALEVPPTEVEPSATDGAVVSNDETTAAEPGAAFDTDGQPSPPDERDERDEPEVPGMPEVPPLTGDAELLAIAKGIEAGELRSLDQLLAAPASEGSHNWLGAANHCKLSSVSGVAGWRLPTKEELWALRKARIVPATGSFWSSTVDLSDAEGKDDKDTVLALVDGRIDGVPKREIGPKALCVRKR